MILEQFITVRISNQGKYYASLGYGYLKQGTVIEVPWYHLPQQSNKKVKVICDTCGCEFVRELQLLNKTTSHLCYSCTKKDIGNKNMNNSIWQSKIKNLRSKSVGEDHPRWNPNKSEFMSYKREVYRVTTRQDLSLLENYDKPRGVCGVEGAYQLDHIISIKHGFENKIPADMIGGISNLQFIPWQVNRDKWYK